jgi:hypothetical protein
MQHDVALLKYTFSFLESGHRQRILWVLKIRRCLTISVPICLAFFFGGQPSYSPVDTPQASRAAGLLQVGNPAHFRLTHRLCFDV